MKQKEEIDLLRREVADLRRIVVVLSEQLSGANKMQVKRELHPAAMRALRALDKPSDIRPAEMELGKWYAKNAQ